MCGLVAAYGRREAKNQGRKQTIAVYHRNPMQQSNK
jgi:hypothetical protein